MLVPMTKVEIIGPKNEFLDVVETLHEQGTVHIEDLSKRIATGELLVDQMEMVGEDFQAFDKLDEMLLRVRAILKALHAPAGGLDAAARKAEYSRLWALEPDKLADEIASTIDDVEDRTADLAALHTAAESEIALLARYEPILGKIQPLARQLVVTGAFETVALLVERRYKAGLEELNKELNKLTNNQCEIISQDIDENTTAAIVVYSKAYGDAVHKFLAMENVNQIRLPDDFKDMPLDAAYHEIKVRREELPAEMDRIRKDLDELSAKWYLKLTAAADVLVDKLDELSAIPKFGRTEYAFMIVGWVPSSDCDLVENRLTERFGNEVIITRCEISEKDFGDVPVQMKNSKAVEPYQWLLGIMGNPSYGTMDPTFLLALFYPLFFGMIVGDIGYGAIMLATVIWLRLRFRDSDAIGIATGVLGPACTMAVAFGFLYGEFFGNLLSKYIPVFPLIEIEEGVKVVVNNPLIPPAHRQRPDPVAVRTYRLDHHVLGPGHHRRLRAGLARTDHRHDQRAPDRPQEARLGKGRDPRLHPGPRSPDPGVRPEPRIDHRYGGRVRGPGHRRAHAVRRSDLRDPRWRHRRRNRDRRKRDEHHVLRPYHGRRPCGRDLRRRGERHG